MCCCPMCLSLLSEIKNNMKSESEMLAHSDVSTHMHLKWKYISAFIPEFVLTRHFFFFNKKLTYIMEFQKLVHCSVTPLV